MAFLPIEVIKQTLSSSRYPLTISCSAITKCLASGEIAGALTGSYLTLLMVDCLSTAYSR